MYAASLYAVRCGVFYGKKQDSSWYVFDLIPWLVA